MVFTNYILVPEANEAKTRECKNKKKRKTEATKSLNRKNSLKK